MSDENIYINALKKDNAELTKQNYDLMKKYSVKTSDPVTNDVIDRIFKRHQQGMEKFKRTMTDNSKSIPEWIEESIEEKIDDISYMSTLKDRIVANEEKLKKDIDMLRDDLTIKDLEMGKMMNKINKLEKQNGKKT
jgi:transcription termination factor NusB